MADTHTVKQERMHIRLDTISKPKSYVGIPQTEIRAFPMPVPGRSENGQSAPRRW